MYWKYSLKNQHRKYFIMWISLVWFFKYVFVFSLDYTKGNALRNFVLKMLLLTVFRKCLEEDEDTWWTIVYFSLGWRILYSLSFIWRDADKANSKFHNSRPTDGLALRYLWENRQIPFSSHHYVPSTPDIGSLDLIFPKMVWKLATNILLTLGDEKLSLGNVILHIAVC